MRFYGRLGKPDSAIEVQEPLRGERRRGDGDLTQADPAVVGRNAVVQQDLMRLRSLALGGAGRWAAVDLSITAREAEVLLWAMRGYSHEEIAARLGSTGGTVGKHLEHAYEKLGVRSRAQAVDRLLLSGPLEARPS